MVGEDRLLVGLPVTVGVFEDDDLVVGHRVARSVGRIGRRRGDPEAALGVERHLHGLLEVRELLFRSEERDLITRGEGHLLDGGFAGEELGRVAVLLARLEVGRHGREDEGLGVVDGQVSALALGNAMNELIPDHGHLAALVDLVGVVLWAERIVTLTVGMHAVEDRVVGVPHVVLHLHRGVDEGFIGLGSARRGAEEAIGEELSHEAVTEVGGRKAVDGVGRLALAVGGEGGVEEVDVGDAMLLGHALHGGGVEFQVSVLLLAIREVAVGGEVFESDRRDEDEARGGLAVVSPGEGMRDEGVNLGFIVGGAARAIEGLVVTEERDDRVGLQVEEPLIRRGEETFAVVLGVFGMELVGTRKGPLAGAGGVRTEGRGVAGAAHVAHDEVLIREAELQLGLKATVVGVAFGKAVADEDDPFTRSGRGGFLAALRGRDRWIFSGRVRCRRALAVIGPVGGVGLILLGLELRVIVGTRLVGGEDAGGEGDEDEEEGAVLHEKGGSAYLYAKLTIIQPDFWSDRPRFPSFTCSDYCFQVVLSDAQTRPTRKTQAVRTAAWPTVQYHWTFGSAACRSPQMQKAPAAERNSRRMPSRKRSMNFMRRTWSSGPTPSRMAR